MFINKLREKSNGGSNNYQKLKSDERKYFKIIQLLLWQENVYYSY